MAKKLTAAEKRVQEQLTDNRNTALFIGGILFLGFVLFAIANYAA